MREVKGPSALGSDPRRFWHLTRTLAVTDFKLRFFGSALGYVWQLMRPLMIFGILYAIFALVLKIDDVPFYAEALLLGLVLFTFLNDAAKGSVGSLVLRQNLVRKIEFPRLAIPMSVVLTALFTLALNLVPVFAFLLIDGGSLRWQWIQLPLLVVLLIALAIGLSMLLSALFVRYRDVEPIWDVTSSILFYGSPIFYMITTVEEESPQAAHLLMLNPFATVMQQARYAVFGEGHPSAGEAIGGYPRLLLPFLLSAAIIALGWWVFSRSAPRIAEEL